MLYSDNYNITYIYACRPINTKTYIPADNVDNSVSIMIINYYFLNAKYKSQNVAQQQCDKLIGNAHLPK